MKSCTLIASIVTALALAATLAFAAPASTPAPNYVLNVVPNGTLLVSLANGEIFQCAAVALAPSARPAGKCAQIGSISIGSGDSVQISSSSSSNVVVVTELQTGAVTECIVSIQSATGTPLGSCVEALAPQAP